jgi:uncharacterized membrane protein
MRMLGQRQRDILRPLVWLSLTGLVLCLPLALFAALLSPNEYAAQGIVGAIDCDGPIEVMLFAAPACMIYGLGTLGFGAVAIRKRVRWYAVMAVLCLAILLMILPNIVNAYLEHLRLEHMESCGAGS